MADIVEELWIFTRDGVPIFEIIHSKDSKHDKHGGKMDNVLLGGFVSAIKSLSQGLSGNAGLNSFSFGKDKYIITTCLKDKIMIVSKSNADIQDKKIKKFFKIITKFFEDLYNVDEVLNWNGDAEFFKRYKDKLEMYLKMSSL